MLGGEGLQHGRHGVPVQGVQPPDVPGEQVIVHHAPVFGSVDPHDVVVVEVLEPGPVPRFAVFPVAGALGPDHVWRYPQRDLPVDSPLALGDLRIAVLDLDVVAEEPRRLAAGVGDQGLLLVQFQPEGLPEERGQPGLDLLGFGLRPDKSQYVIIRVPYVLQAAVTGVHRVDSGERAKLLPQVTGGCPVPALPRAFQLPGYPLVLGIGFPAGSPRVLRDQFLPDEFVELVQVDVAEDRGCHAALRNSAERFIVFPVFQVPGFQHVPYQPEEPVVVDFLRQYPEKDFVVKRPEAVGDITLDKPCGPGPGIIYLPQRGMAPSFPPEPVRIIRELRLIVRLKEQADHFAD